MQVFSNGASSLLTVDLTDSDTVITITGGDGARFPAVDGGDPDEYAVCVLENVSGDTEVVQVTDRSSDTFTVVRGFDGSTPIAWSIGDRFELRNTAHGMERMIQRDDDVVDAGTF